MNFPGLERLTEKLRRSDNIGPVILALAVGLAGGIGAILFRYFIESIDWLFFERGSNALSFLGEWYVIVLPAVGLLLVVNIVRRWAPEAQGHGVPEVMYAVKKEGGRIRPRVALVKSITSALCIGSGGSVGREGPIVQIGCSMGSTLGQLLGLREERIKLLVACGAAAGISGTFNAPIAGVIFGLEVILGTFAARSFGMIVISSVTSTALCRSILGEEVAFRLVEVFQLKSPLELFLYMGLGVIAGTIALGYVRCLYFFERLFERWENHFHLRAIIGGLLVGLIGYMGIKFFGGRHLLGVGYDGIEGALGLGKEVQAQPELSRELTFSVLLILVALKILSTSITLSAGGSGGVFAPALYIGAMAGGAFGLVAESLFPQITAPAGAYALVGMGALFAGAAHAPITSILILFEMTDDYKIILPLMLAVVISHLVASTLSADSVYTIKLRRLGGLTPPKSELSVLDLILVADAMNPPEHTIRTDSPVSEILERFYRGLARSFPVLDEDGRLVGFINESDIETALIEGRLDDQTAADLMHRNPVTCTPDQSLSDVLHELTAEALAEIPVVDKEDSHKLLGLLGRREIFWAYGKMAGEHQRLLTRTGFELPTDHRDSVQIEIQVRPEHTKLAFKKVRDVSMPDQCLIVVLRRAERSIVPRGDTVIEPGDMLVALTTRAHEATLRQWVGQLNGH